MSKVAKRVGSNKIAFRVCLTRKRQSNHSCSVVY